MKWLLVTAFAALLIVLTVLALAIDGGPRVPPRDDVAPADIERAVALAQRHRPGLAPVGQARLLELSARDIDLLVEHAARHWLDADARARTAAGRLDLEVSLAAPLGRWLNIAVGLRQTAALPEVDRLRVGRLPLPPALVLPVLRWLARQRGVQADALLDIHWIERVAITPATLSVSYRIEADTVSRLRTAVVAPADQERLRAYHQHLVAASRSVAGDSIALAPLLRSMFALAAARSAGGHATADENRAALLTLAMYANGRPLGLVMPAAYGWPQPRPLRVTLHRRNDSALHFLVSAVLAAEAGSPLAQAVGVWKELADAQRGGSGFSFNDLAADRAGSRFGELALRDAADLQDRVAAAAGDADLMPVAGDLPEAISEAAFAARYGGVGGAGYNRVLADIERRVGAMPLFR